MELYSKRRKVSRKAGGPAGIHRYAHEGSLLSEGRETQFYDHGPSRASHSPKSYNENIARSPKDQAFEESRLSNLHPRNLIPTQVHEAVQSPSKTVVASVIQVVVNDGTGSEVTQLLIPVSSKLVSVQGFAPITLGKGPSGASPSAVANPNNSNNQQPTAINPTGPNSYPAAKTAIAASRTGKISESRPTQSGGYGHSNPMSISGPDSKSQVVLSSPPSTPLPSTPMSTTPSSSTGSYFSSSAPGSSSLSDTALITSGGSSTATIRAQSPTPVETPNASNVPAPSTSNSTFVLTSSQSGAQTTSASPSLNNPAFSSFNSSSTFLTSTRSRSSFATGASLTSSGTLSQSASSFAASSSGSASASRTAFSSSVASSTQFSSFSPSSSASSTGGAAGGIGGPGSTTASPTSSATSGAGSGGGRPISTPVVVGGVFGGLAGFAAILVLILFFVRWRRSKTQRRAISPPLPQSLPPGVASTAPTTQRSSIVPFAAGGFMRRMRPGSGQTAETTETNTSERGFQNLGGRRLQSVLSSRGDGYSDPAPPSGVAPRGYAGTAAGLGLAAEVASPASRGPGLSPGPSENETLSGSSFYRDSQGFYGGNEAGPSSPPPTSPTSAAGSPPGEGIAVTRAGPARTPVINQPGFSALRPPPGTGRGTPPPIGRGTPPPGAGRGTPPPRNLTPQLRQQDEVGRSHPSFDGSRGSRFSERFSEGV